MQAKEPFKILRQPIKTSISYMIGNLTASDKFIAYANLQEPQQILIYPIRQELEFQLGLEISIKQQFDEQITDIKYVQFSNGWKLVIATQSAFYIYKEDGSKLTGQFKKVLGQGYDPKNKEQQIPLHFFKSITQVKTQDQQELLCVGTSCSEVYFSQASKEFSESFVGLQFLKKPVQITALVGTTFDSQLIVADSLGTIQIFMATNIKEIGYIKEIASTSNQSPIMAMEVMNRKKKNQALNNLLVCGDFIGRIVLYDLVEYTQVAIINAHIKMITAIDCNGENCEIVSGSEDTYLNFWKVENDNDVNVKVSYRLADQLIVGIQYLKLDKSPIIVSCLESTELTFLHSNY